MLVDRVAVLHVLTPSSVRGVDSLAVVASLVTGALTGLTLILAIGAQNAFVLRQGVLGEHVGVVVAICVASDVVLIAAGVGGIGVLVEQAGWLLEVVRWLGVAFLTTYGLLSLRRAWHAGALSPDDAPRPGRSRGAVALTAVALTWLNPHVYLDTVLLLGSVAAQQGPTRRWWFGLGAMLGSLVWFLALGYGARSLRGLLARPRAWQVLDVAIGLVMLALALVLVPW